MLGCTAGMGERLEEKRMAFLHSHERLPPHNRALFLLVYNPHPSYPIVGAPSPEQTLPSQSLCTPNSHTASIGTPHSAAEMQRQERHHPRVTFALPPPSPSPPREVQQQKGSTSQSQSQRQLVGPKRVEEKRPVRAPPTLTAAQLVAHAAGPSNIGDGSNHNPHSSPSSSSSSSSCWTISYPRLRIIPDGKPLTHVDSNMSWPGAVIAYQRLPSCFDSPEEAQPMLPGPTNLVNSTRLGSASGSAPKAPDMLDGSGRTRATTPNLRPGNGDPPSVSARGGTNPHRPATGKQPWAWTWTPGATAAPIYDPDYVDGPPECLAPRSSRPTSPSASVDSWNTEASRIGRSAATKRLRGGEFEATPPVEHEDTRSNVSGSSTGSYVSCASDMFASEFGGVGPLGTVESIWGEQLSDLRGLRL